VQLDTVSGARLVPSRSTGKCKSNLKIFYVPVSANGAAASWDNSRSDGRADTVLLCTRTKAERRGVFNHGWTQRGLRRNHRFGTVAGIPQSGSHAAFGSNRQHGKRCRRCAPVFAALRPGRLPPQSKSLSSVREVTGLYYGFLPHLSRRNLMKAERGQKAQIIKRRGRGETRRFAEDFFSAFLCVLCVHPPQYCYGGRVLCVKIGFASAFFGTTGSTPINREQAPINSVSASTRQSRCRERAPKPFPVISPLVWSSSPIKSRILSLIRFITVRLC
jgi:hypothetical protein